MFIFQLFLMVFVQSATFPFLSCMYSLADGTFFLSWCVSFAFQRDSKEEEGDPLVVHKDGKIWEMAGSGRNKSFDCDFAGPVILFIIPCTAIVIHYR